MQKEIDKATFTFYYIYIKAVILENESLIKTAFTFYYIYIKAGNIKTFFKSTVLNSASVDQ